MIIYFRVWLPYTFFFLIKWVIKLMLFGGDRFLPMFFVRFNGTLMFSKQILIQNVSSSSRNYIIWVNVAINTYVRHITTSQKVWRHHKNVRITEINIFTRKYLSEGEMIFHVSSRQNSCALEFIVKIRLIDCNDYEFRKKKWRNKSGFQSYSCLKLRFYLV